MQIESVGFLNSPELSGSFSPSLFFLGGGGSKCFPKHMKSSRFSRATVFIFAKKPQLHVRVSLGHVAVNCRFRTE